MDFASFFAEYGSVLRLVVVFAGVIVVVKMKKPLSFSIGVGAALTILLYRVDPLTSLKIIFKACTSNAAIMVILSCYLITFLQRMLEQRGDLDLAQVSMSRLFNNRRVNASVTPAFIGLLPSPGAIFIAGAMIERSCGDYLSKEDQTFVATFFRHIPESFLPTYSFIIIACNLVDVSMGSFVLGMLPQVALLGFLGYLFYLRKIPKETGELESENKKLDGKNLFVSLWPIIAIIVLIVAFHVQVYAATVAILIMYFFTGRFQFKQIVPYFKTAWDWRIFTNTLVVMTFKDLLVHTGVISDLPPLLSKLPIPTFLVFGLIFIFGSILAGSLSITTLCLPMAFAAIPGAGLPLMVFLMGCTYVAMQVSPTHVCLTLACEHFNTDFGGLIKRTIPVISVYFVVSVFYYLLLTAII